MRIATRSIIILVNQVIATAVPVVMAIILTRMLAKSELGIYRQVTMVYLLVSSILSLNIPNSMYYFLPKAKEVEHRGILFQTILTLFVMAVAATLLMWFGADVLARYIAKDPALAAPLKAYSFFALGNMISLVISPALISKERVVLAGVYQISQSVIRVTAIVTAFAIGLSVERVMHIAVLTSAVAAVIGLALLLFTTVKGQIRITTKMFTEQMHYVIPLAAAGLTGILSRYLDKWIIMYFFASAQFAVYSIGATQIPVVSLITVSVTNAMMPDIVRLGKENKMRKAMGLWHEGIRKCSLVIFPAYIFCLIASRDLIVLFFSKDYIESLGPFIIYLTLIPIQVAFSGTILRATGNTRPILFAAICGLLVNMVLSVMLVVVFQGTYIAFLAPAIATVIALLAMSVYQLAYVAKVTSVNFRKVFPWPESLKILSLAGFCGVFIIPLYFLLQHEILRVSTAFMLYSTIYVFALFGFKILRDDEKEMLFMPLEFLKKRFLKGLQ